MTDHAIAQSNRVKAQITFQRDGRRRSLLQNVRRNIDKRRTTLGDECRRQFRARAIGHVKRAAMRVQNARRAFYDQAMQVMGPDRFAERFTEPVQEIEDECFLDLNFLFRAFQDSNPLGLPQRGEDPPGDRREQQSEEKNRPHVGRASLLRRRLVMKVLL